MSEYQQSKPVSMAEPGPSPTRDIAREAIALAKALEYQDWELVEAVDSAGLADTLGFLRRQAAAKSISLRAM